MRVSDPWKPQDSQEEGRRIRPTKHRTIFIHSGNVGDGCGTAPLLFGPQPARKRAIRPREGNWSGQTAWGWPRPLSGPFTGKREGMGRRDRKAEDLLPHDRIHERG